jgi:hypothetical protein
MEAAGLSYVAEVLPENVERRSLSVAGGWKLCRLTILALLAVLPGWAATPHPTQDPSVVIPVADLGYNKPGDFYLTLRLALVSLDYVDANHLLFTFQKKSLMRHMDDCEPNDDDQLIHAVVLEIPTGKEVASADWRMHDKRRYIWPLGKGTFLVRQRDTLYVTDSTLKLHEYGHFPGHLLAVQTVPEGDVIVAETMEPDHSVEASQPGAAANSFLSEFSPNAPKPILLRVIRLKDGKLMGMTRMRVPIVFPANASGYIECIEGQHSQWLMSFATLDGSATPPPPHPIAQVTSSCQPTVVFLSRDKLMAMRCSQSRDHSTIALDLDGNKLWEKSWQSNHIWPTMTRAEDGSRFAQGSLIVPGAFSITAPIGGGDSISAQLIEVYDTASGKLLMSAPASPVYDSGQNYALSPDGHQFAVVHDGTIQLFDLAPGAAPPLAAQSRPHP